LSTTVATSAKRRARILAIEQGRTLSKLVDDAIMEYLDRHEPKEELRR
jgi:hypothetical protein